MGIKNHISKNKIFLKDNFILFISIFILNLFGYLFHFYVGRKLGPEDYGIFGSLLSLIYFIAVPMLAIQTSITEFVSGFKDVNLGDYSSNHIFCINSINFKFFEDR